MPVQQSWETRSQTTILFDRGLSIVILKYYPYVNFTTSLLEKKLKNSMWDNKLSEGKLLQKIRRSLKYMVEAGFLKMYKTLKTEGKSNVYKVVDSDKFAEANSLNFKEISKMTYPWFAGRLVFPDSIHPYDHLKCSIFIILGSLMDIGKTFDSFSLEDLKKIWPSNSPFNKTNVEAVIDVLLEGKLLSKVTNNTYKHNKYFCTLNHIREHIISQYGRVINFPQQAEINILDALSKMSSAFSLVDFCNQADSGFKMSRILYVLHKLQQEEIISVKHIEDKIQSNYLISFINMEILLSKLKKLKGDVKMSEENALPKKEDVKKEYPKITKSETASDPEFEDYQIGLGVIALVDDLREKLAESTKYLNEEVVRNLELVKENKVLKDEVESYKSANESIIAASKELENKISILNQEILDLKSSSVRSSGRTMKLRPLD